MSDRDQRPPRGAGEGESGWKGIRVVLESYSASFRVPSLAGYQLTLPVPPLSTVYGLLSAAGGRWIDPQEVPWLAFSFTYEGRAVDLESIVTFERPKSTSVAAPTGRNVVRREFLTFTRLALFLPQEWAEVFHRPRFPLVLGRSQDVAALGGITEEVLEPVEEGTLTGVLLPATVLGHGLVEGWLQSLPLALSEDPERRPLAVEPFAAVDCLRHRATVRLPGWLARAADGTVVPVYRREWVCERLRR